MARHKRQQAIEDPEPGLDISSLIDVCFLLLIYFIVTSTIIPREGDLGLKLPTPGSRSEPPVLAPLLIKVEESGAIFVDDQPMDADADVRTLPQLNDRLQIYKRAVDAAGEQPMVQIWANGQSSNQRVIDVLNALAGVQINAVTFTDLVE